MMALRPRALRKCCLAIRARPSGTRASSRRRRLLDARVPLGLALIARQHFLRARGRRAIIFYGDSPIWMLFVALLSRATGAYFVVEICEYPFINEQGAVKLAIKRWLQDRVAYRSVDGFISISKYLQDYVAAHAPRAIAQIRVPILVDASLFTPPPRSAPPTKGRLVTYVGGCLL